MGRWLLTAAFKILTMPGLFRHLLISYLSFLNWEALGGKFHIALAHFIVKIGVLLYLNSFLDGTI